MSRTVEYYDPPSGWRYGFPKPYRPLKNESLEYTLLRDGYPKHLINLTQYTRFFSVVEEEDNEE